MTRFNKWSKIKQAVAVVLILIFAIGIAMLITFFPYKGKDSITLWNQTMQYGAAADAAAQKVYKTYGEDYRIMQFTDVQLDYDQGAMKKARALIKKSIEDQKPDLIVFTGDTVQGPLGHYQLKKFVKYMDGFGIPYAPIMGNHERDSVSDMNYMAEIWESGEYSLFRKGPRTVHGYGNYFIHVMERQPDGTEKMVYMLSMLDTGGGYAWQQDADGNYLADSPSGETLSEVGHGYDLIYPDQMAYYAWQVQGVSDYYGYAVPSMVFTHIPVPEFEAAWEQWAGKNTDFDPLEGNKNYVENITIPAEDGYGRRYEDICAGMFNSGFFEMAKATGSLTHIFAGHEHVNNFSILYEGIRLTYGQKTGTCSYARDDMQGHTRITLSSLLREDGYNQVHVASYHYDGTSFSVVA